MLHNKKILLFIFLGLIAATTFLLLLEVKPTPQTWPKDKLQHVLVFALLTYLGIKAYPKYIFYICLGLVFYGGLLEVLQSQLTQTRTGSYADWLADLVGIFIVVALIKSLNKEN